MQKTMQIPDIYETYVKYIYIYIIGILNTLMN